MLLPEILSNIEFRGKNCQKVVPTTKTDQAQGNAHKNGDASKNYSSQKKSKQEHSRKGKTKARPVVQLKNIRRVTHYPGQPFFETVTPKPTVLRPKKPNEEGKKAKEDAKDPKLEY